MSEPAQAEPQTDGPPPAPRLMPGVYQHYKGNKYFVMGVAEHTETSESLVIYVPMYEHPSGGRPLRARPLSMFTELVTVGSPHYLYPRFRYVGDVVPPAVAK